MMEWVVQQMTHTIQLPLSLPHLTAEQREQYIEQVVEREERVFREQQSVKRAESREKYDEKMYRHNQRIKQQQQQQQQQ